MEKQQWNQQQCYKAALSLLLSCTSNIHRNQDEQHSSWPQVPLYAHLAWFWKTNELSKSPLFRILPIWLNIMQTLQTYGIIYQ